VWDGGAAHQLGLVDSFGGIDDAVAKAAQLAKLGDERRVAFFDPPSTFEDELIDAYASDNEDDGSAPADAYATLVDGPRAQMAALVGQLQSMLDGPVMQVRCLECATLGAPQTAAAKAPSGFWATLLGRLLAA
jgi:protease-4